MDTYSRIVDLCIIALMQPEAAAGMCHSHNCVVYICTDDSVQKHHLGLVVIVFAVIGVVVVGGHVTAMGGGNDGAMSGSDVSGRGARHGGLCGGVGGTNDSGLGGCRSTWDGIILNDVAHC